jgi:hypothetical protein
MAEAAPLIAKSQRLKAKSERQPAKGWFPFPTGYILLPILLQ